MKGRVSDYLKVLKREKGYLFEALFCLAISRLRIASKPFNKIVPLLGTPEIETDHQTSEKDRQTIYRISSSVITVARHTPWQSKCLVQVMAARRMLQKRGIASTIYLGLGKNDGKEMIAHAWIRSGDVFLTSVKGKRKFSVVAKYGALPSDHNTNRQKGRKHDSEL